MFSFYFGYGTLDPGLERPGKANERLDGFLIRGMRSVPLHVQRID